jgi:hypothetical protein
MTEYNLEGLNPKEAKNFYFPRNAYHWISQRDFIVGPFETRTVDYILQMEDMSPYFEQLVTAFGLPQLHWPATWNNAAPISNSTTTKAAEVPGNLATAICKYGYPYVANDLALWKNSVLRDVIYFQKPSTGIFVKVKFTSVFYYSNGTLLESRAHKGRIAEMKAINYR